jgi:hypothetical protein
MESQRVAQGSKFVTHLSWAGSTSPKTASNAGSPRERTVRAGANPAGVSANSRDGRPSKPAPGSYRPRGGEGDTAARRGPCGAAAPSGIRRGRRTSASPLSGDRARTPGDSACTAADAIASSFASSTFLSIGRLRCRHYRQDAIPATRSGRGVNWGKRYQAACPSASRIAGLNDRELDVESFVLAEKFLEGFARVSDGANMYPGWRCETVPNTAPSGDRDGVGRGNARWLRGEPR